jgi:ligand-binding sensor domain-containing protein
MNILFQKIKTLISKILVFAVLFLLVISQSSFPQQWDWETFTNADDVRNIAGNDSVLWCATNGGILRMSTQTRIIQKFTNSDGLSKNDFRAIALDKHNNVWAADDNGLFNYYNSSEKIWKIKSHYKDQIINQIYPYGDSLFIAFNKGVSLFIPNSKDPQGWEVKETYYIGDSKEINIANETIWVAQENRVKFANLNFPNLQAPTAWEEFTSANHIAGSAVNSLLHFDNSIWIATNDGVSRFDGEYWGPVELQGKEISSLSVQENKLVAAAGKAIFKRTNTNEWDELARGDFNIVDLFVDSFNLILTSSHNGMFFLDEANNTLVSAQSNGPIDNKFNALAIDLDGNLWAASSIGLSMFDGDTWKTFGKDEGISIGSLLTAVTVDASNKVWAASWGGGITVLEKMTDDQYLTTVINYTDGRLAGVSEDPNYVVITDLQPDASGNMWILNSEADNKNVVAVTETGPSDTWQYFSTLDGINSINTATLEIDAQGRKWIGTSNAGITVISDNGTPFDKSDDDLDQGLKKEDGLESEHIRSIAEDLDGVMWIGTPEGLNYWFDSQVFPKYGTINDDINCILVDAANNKWIGTSGGLTMLHSDGFQMSHFSTDDSPLPANNITAFAFNEKTGEIYVGTTNGLSRLTTPFTKPQSTLTLVSGYPNPFVLVPPEALFTIDNLAVNSSVNIYTAEGFLIRKFTKDQIFGARVLWDGKNDAGDLVTSGIYVYLVTTEKGLAKTGKVAVIKP